LKKYATTIKVTLLIIFMFGLMILKLSTMIFEGEVISKRYVPSAITSVTPIMFSSDSYRVTIQGYLRGKLTTTEHNISKKLYDKTKIGDKLNFK
jgi:hypothetical protein